RYQVAVRIVGTKIEGQDMLAASELARQLERVAPPLEKARAAQCAGDVGHQVVLQAQGVPLYQSMDMVSQLACLRANFLSHVCEVVGADLADEARSHTVGHISRCRVVTGREWHHGRRWWPWPRRLSVPWTRDAGAFPSASTRACRALPSSRGGAPFPRPKSPGEWC